MPDPIKTPLHPKSPLPVGTKVQYHGSHPDHHGDYVITSIADADMLRAMGRDPDTNYSIDRVGYELCPVGMERSYRNHAYMLYYVRRGSITPIGDLGYTAKDIAEFREWPEDPEFRWYAGSSNIPKFKAIVDAAEKLLIREADSAT
jgi:hypothetical protein